MSKKTNKIWYAFQGGTAHDGQFSFYDSSKYQWAKEIQSSFENIKAEVFDFLHDIEPKPYFNQELVKNKNSWLTSSALVWGWPVRKNLKSLNSLKRIAKAYPQIVSISTSILEPRSKIEAHRGDTNAIIRAHLPLKVPALLPNCGIKVAGESRSWEEGKLLLFNDAALHEAWNNTDQKRYVLILDIIKPEFIKRKFSICSTVISVLILQSLANKLPFLVKVVWLVKIFLVPPMLVSVYCTLRLRGLIRAI